MFCGTRTRNSRGTSNHRPWLRSPRRNLQARHLVSHRILSLLVCDSCGSDCHRKDLRWKHHRRGDDLLNQLHNSFNISRRMVLRAFDARHFHSRRPPLRPRTSRSWIFPLITIHRGLMGRMQHRLYSWTVLLRHPATWRNSPPCVVDTPDYAFVTYPTINSVIIQGGIYGLMSLFVTGVVAIVLYALKGTPSPEKLRHP